MYDNIFNRVEQKYLLTEKTYLSLIKEIDSYIEKDKFYETKIYNIYFDNDNHDLIINSIEKPPFKLKVRLRSYGIPSQDDEVFLEIKTKYKKIVNKRRIKIKLKEFNKYLKDGTYDENNQIAKEIDYLFKYYKLKPFYFLAYDRKSYKAKENSNLRITFDENLRSRKDNLEINCDTKCKYYFKDKMYIMEIKSLNALPLWLVKRLSELKIYPISFSKLGNVYKQEMEEVKC